jgi:hypothetical protein
VLKAVATFTKTAPVSLFSSVSVDFHQGGSAVTSCCMCVETRTACHAAAHDRSVPGGRSWGGSFGRAWQQCQTHLCVQKQGCMGSLPGFSMETTRTCFHAVGKYCLRRTALNTRGKCYSMVGRSLRALFWTPYRTGALPALFSSTTYRAPENLVNFSSFGGCFLLCAHRLINHLNFRRVIHLLKLIFMAVSQVFFSRNMNVRELVLATLTVRGGGRRSGNSRHSVCHLP